MRDRSRSSKALALPVAALALAAALAPGAAADDRDLLRTASGRPYVFILFDTSGSMNWAPKCTLDQYLGSPPGCVANPSNPDDTCIPKSCDLLCSDGDCFAPLNGDDPSSKFYQAKEALYEVLSQVDDVDFGFATYNQDELFLRGKHWLYEATSAGVDIPGWGPFPAVGTREVFGYQWACDNDGNTTTNNNNSGDREVGCYGTSTEAADLDDAWELNRMLRLPKGGDDFDENRIFYIESPGGTRYRIDYEPNAGSLGDASVQMDVERRRCTDSSCSSTDSFTEVTVTYQLVDQFASWDNGAERDSVQNGYFSQGYASDSSAQETCGGWDPNDDSGVDDKDGYSIRWPTTADPSPALSPELDRGDVLPLDWRTDHKTAVLQRLAPNTILGETPPDFSIARYFQDSPVSGELRLVDSNVRPMVPNGATPLGASIQDFRTWYAGCAQGSCPNSTGWKDIAAELDPDWGCRRKFLIVLSDGDETCGGGASACNGTAALRAQESITTYVVAFGVPSGSGNTLTCMANNGGSSAPVFPENKDDLVRALQDIFGEIAESTRTFASAAVPTVEAQVADKIFLTNFTPLNSASVWPGHIDAYLKPLPLNEARQPDETKACGAGVESGCHLWDAADVLLTQAPDQDDITSGDLRLGPGVDERRLYYPQQQVADNLPLSKHLFEPPSNLGDEFDLWTGLGIPFDPSDPATLVTARDRVQAIIEFTVKQKNDTIDLGGVSTPVTYVMGDIFHSDPAVTTNPNRFRYFTSDLYGNGADCSLDAADNPGYRCFFHKHSYRRKMVVVGANDAQLHAFDTGRFDGSVVDGEVDGVFDNGTGKEIFSVIPRSLLPRTLEAAETTRQDWGVDGSVLVDDFFIDPSHTGIPDPDEREWRSVALTGLREGGRAYLAVDITQPDKIQSSPIAQGFFLPDDGGSSDYVPTCLSAYNASQCGPLAFPSVLWEFTDDELPNEDGVGGKDLGEAWSTPNTGRLRVIEDGEEVDKFVAVVGGGMDPDKQNLTGNWLYIIDVETGKPIYKRELDGSAPSEPAAVDTDQNGYLDTIYIGTTAGFLYKADISVPKEIVEVDVMGTIVRRVTDADWDPVAIFGTGGRPIFFPPAVVYVPHHGRYALAFGAGDREDLWDLDGVEGRFYMILDQDFDASTVGLPLTEGAYTTVTADGGEESGTSFLLNPPVGRRPGWVMLLEADERVITKAFSLSGITVFTSYMPDFNTFTGDPGNGNDPAPVCSKTGESRIFVVYTDSANAVLTLEGQKVRYWLVSEFVTEPFTEQSATKNPPGEDEGSHADQLTDELREVMETLKGLFPSDCRFGNFTMNIKTIRSDTGVVFIAPVPICIIEKNWKEF